VLVDTPTGATRRKPLASLVIVAVAVALSASPAGCGSSSASSSAAGRAGSRAGLVVSPSTGAPRSELRFSFTAPVAGGRQGATDIAYTLSIAGPHRSGCVGVHALTLSRVRRGELVTTELGPAQLGRPWCPGRFTARVDELARPVCAAGQMCPQFIRLVARVGRAGFSIAG
jgi:hypothetical protein